MLGLCFAISVRVRPSACLRTRREHQEGAQQIENVFRTNSASGGKMYVDQPYAPVERKIPWLARQSDDEAGAVPRPLA
jgi:hypothetical protein